MTLLCVATSCGSSAAADKLAARMINSRLAACAQITPITSHYIWNGALQRAQEFKLELKTLPALRAQIEAAILAAHDYDLPEIIYTEVTASQSYANWVKDRLAPKP